MFLNMISFLQIKKIPRVLFFSVLWILQLYLPLILRTFFPFFLSGHLKPPNFLRMDHFQKLNARSEIGRLVVELLFSPSLFVFIHRVFLECFLILYLTQSHTERGQTGLFYLRVSKNESFDLFRQHTLHLLIKSSLISKVTPGSLTPSPTSLNFILIAE